MPSIVRQFVSIGRCLLAVLILVCLASAARGQVENAPPPSIPEERPAQDRSSEERTTSEEAENRDVIETDRNSFTFARMPAGASRLIVESS